MRLPHGLKTLWRVIYKWNEGYTHIGRITPLLCGGTDSASAENKNKEVNGYE